MTSASASASAPERIPTEFRYFERRGERWVGALRLMWRTALGFDPALPDDVVRTLGSMYYDADPLAEAFVDEVYLARGADIGRAMLDRAIRDGVDSVEDAPASLVALFSDIERDPAWADPAKIALGARVFRRWGTAVFRFAGAITLSAYTESSVAKPLVLTGAYSGASTKHRFLETASFWIDVSEPNGLERGAPGLAAALRVRIMHVFVRRRLASHPEWDEDAWGVPISQADALLTLMGGSVAPALALRAMGYRTSPDEIDALLCFWRYVGHLMGVRPRWYPANAREALSLGFVTMVKAAGRAGEDGRELSRSYVEAFTPVPDPSAPLLTRIRDAFEHRVHLGYTRLFLPPPIHARFGLPSAGVYALYPLAQLPLRFAFETARRHSRAMDDLADRMARAERRRWLARHLGTDRARFEPAQRFTR